MRCMNVVAYICCSKQIWRFGERLVGGELVAACSARLERGGALRSRSDSCPAGTEAFLLSISAACAARGKAGPVMGLRPLLGPPCIPPEAPPVLPRPTNTFFGGGYARTSPTCRLRFFMTPPPAMACSLPEKQRVSGGILYATSIFDLPDGNSIVLRPPRQSDALALPYNGKAPYGIARRVGRSPDQGEGSSRSKRRAALAKWWNLESP